MISFNPPKNIMRGLLPLPILQRRRLRVREVKQLVQGHTAKKEVGQGFESRDRWNRFTLVAE